MLSFLENEKVTRVADGAAAAYGGGATVTSDVVDMNGFGSVVFIAAVGAVDSTGTATLAVETSDNDTTGFGAITDATASLTSADDNGLLVVEVFQPAKRYVRATLARATANSVCDGIIAIQRDAAYLPVTQDATVIDSAFVPATAEP